MLCFINHHVEYSVMNETPFVQDSFKLMGKSLASAVITGSLQHSSDSATESG